MKSNQVDILAFGAHPDDIEISISGTVIKHIKAGYTAGVIDLTRGEFGTRGTAEIRRQEAAAAAGFMGLTIRENLELPDGFVEVNRENKMKIISVIRKYRPKVILMPMEQDRHPDHGACGRLVRESCFLSGLQKIENGYAPHKPSQIFNYFLAWEADYSFVIDISEQFEDKMQAIRLFGSQFYQGGKDDEPETLLSKPDFLDWIENRARYYGNRIGVKYGEPFFSPGVMKANDLVKLKTGPFTT